MVIIRSVLNVRANDGAVDNKLIIPDGGDVYIELNRGFNCVIPSYGVAICTRDAQNNLHVETTVVNNGQFPPAGNPNAPAPLYKLGPPASLVNRCIVVLTSAVTDSGAPGTISVIIHFLQKNADNTYRRVDWKADSIQAVQLQSRFEVDILP